jgi:hypothetical protein
MRGFILFGASGHSACGQQLCMSVALSCTSAQVLLDYEKGLLATARITLRGNRVVILVSAAELMSTIKALAVDDLPAELNGKTTPSSILKLLKVAKAPLLKKLAGLVTFYHCTTGFGDLVYTPAGFIQVDAVGGDEDCYGVCGRLINPAEIDIMTAAAQFLTEHGKADMARLLTSALAMARVGVAVPPAADPEEVPAPPADGAPPSATSDAAAAALPQWSPEEVGLELPPAPAADEA